MSTRRLADHDVPEPDHSGGRLDGDAAANTNKRAELEVTLSDLVNDPERVGIVPPVSEAFQDIGIFEAGPKSLAVVRFRGERQFPEGQDIDQSHHPLRMDKNGYNGKGARLR
ncbi:hypothetical protein DL766_006775 [Monosporascus sp. MC13-8B]|uniref:Selenoprotein O n=1 Tax=Monosporascus cannonballus TaxID=155416 RepID=A0ABY0HF55_9PEZI|nr:hypothetical protein DL763_008766 [Monosporascus cannonballus]RYO91699.1 hypothetical protein DL762_002028 [Monosporascus cannonballus]RYP26282.1 hypothetical protein DL766_006775 [Monosporascus sp. MC13-8B]